MNKIEIFEKILNRHMDKNKMVCKRCGEYQTHKTIWCKGCGSKFVYQPKTYFDWIEAICHRAYQHKATAIRPEYIGAIHQRELKKQDIKKEDFILYLKEKLNNYE